MKSLRLIHFTFPLLLLTLVSCKPDPGDAGPARRYEEYFPLKPGSWRIYQVDSTGKPTPHNDFVNSNYQVREVIDSAYTDGTGRKMYKVLRYRRVKESDPWVLVQVAAAGIAGNEGILQEGNSRYVKLLFPVKDGRVWNANMYNDEDPEGLYTSKYIGTHQTFSDTAGQVFDSTLVVELNNETTAINRDYRMERYATGIGLIEMRHDSVTTQNQTFYLRKRIVSFGK